MDKCENFEESPISSAIEIWFVMVKLKGKYVLPYYHNHLLHKWRRITQGNKSANEYIIEFDEFLTRYNILCIERDIQVFSRFMARFREDQRTKLLARGIIELEKAYELVKDVDSVRINHTFKSHDYRASVYRSFYLPNSIGLVPKPII